MSEHIKVDQQNKQQDHKRQVQEKFSTIPSFASPDSALQTNPWGFSHLPALSIADFKKFYVNFQILN